MKAPFEMRAAHNAWANGRLYAAAQSLPDADYRRWTGQVHGSLHHMLNRIFVADIVWMTTNAGSLAEIMGGAHGEGFEGQWGGNGPSFSPLLLPTDAGPLLTASSTHLAPYTAIGTGDSSGMADVVSLMQEYAPDKPYLSVYVTSWLMGEIARQGLEKAVENGELTRAGVAAALQSIEVDFQGLASNSNYAAADPNDQIARGSWIFKPDHNSYNPDATMGADTEGEGLTLIEENYISDVAANWAYEPCFEI